MFKSQKLFFKTSIRTYCGCLQINRDNNTFEIDIYIGEPYWSDGTQKYLNEATWIGGWEDEPLKSVTAPIEKARQIIEEYEMTEKTINYLKLKSNFIDLRQKEAGQTPKKDDSKPAIHDYAEKMQTNHISYLISNPGELDQLDEMERKRILKENAELRIAYHEMKAIRRAGGAL